MNGKKKINSPESLVYFYIMTKKNIFREKFSVAKPRYIENRVLFIGKIFSNYTKVRINII